MTNKTKRYKLTADKIRQYKLAANKAKNFLLIDEITYITSVIDTALEMLNENDDLSKKQVAYSKSVLTRLMNKLFAQPIKLLNKVELETLNYLFELNEEADMNLLKDKTYTEDMCNTFSNIRNSIATKVARINC